MALNTEKTSELLELIKKRQKEATEHGRLLDKPTKEAIDNEVDEDEEEEDEEDQLESEEEVRKVPQHELNVLPLVQDRLSHPDFANNSSEFEYQMLMWLLAQCSETLRSVLTAEDLQRAVQPVHKLLMERLGECSKLPLRKEISSNHLYSYNTTTKTFSLTPTSSNATGNTICLESEVITESHDHPERELTAILVSVDSETGSEAMEIQHLAYVLKTKLGYKKVITLAGEDATAELLDQALSDNPNVALVHARIGETETPTTLTFPPQSQGKSEMPLSWIKNKTPSTACVVIDALSTCTFTTGDTDSHEITFNTGGNHSSVPTTCAWLFDGFFTPLVTEAFYVDPPRTVSELIHNVVKMSGDDSQTVCLRGFFFFFFFFCSLYQRNTQQELTKVRFEDFDKCLISFGLKEDKIKREDDDDDDDVDEE